MTLLSKRKLESLLLFLAFFLAASPLAHAQSVSPFFGLGSARDSIGTSVNEGCPTGQLFDGVICEAGPKMGGLFGLLGVDVMFRKHLGVDGEYAFKLKQAPFLPADSLSMRPMFYDLNALWQPFSGEHFVPFLEGGFGAAKISLRMTQPTSITGVTSTSGFSAGSNTNHFQLHGAFGVKLYVHGNLFVKPQVDLRYVVHLTDQFGRNTVVQFMGSVGYTFGQH